MKSLLERISSKHKAQHDEEDTDHLDNTDLEYQRQQYSDDLEDCLALLTWDDASRQKLIVDPEFFLEVATA